MHASVTGMGLSQGDFFLPAKYRPPSSPIARTPSNPQISEGTASEPLVLVVIRGEHLAPQSTFGFADPYIKIGLDGEPPVTSTQTTQKSPHSRPKLLGPLAQFQWQERLQCTVPLASSVVDLYCYDAAPLQSDELIGRGVVELGQRLEDEMWVPLHDTATGGRKGRVLICLHWPDRVKPRATAAAAAAAALGAALQEAARRSAEAEAARRAMCKRAAAGAATAALAAAAVHSAESIAAAEAAQAAAEAAARAAEAARQAALRSAAAAAAPACLIAAAADAATSIARAEAEAKARAEAQARLIAAVRAAGSAAVASAVVTAVALAPVPPPWIGFLVKQRKGKPVIIEDVAHDGPAEKCGLQDGDVMVSIAGDPIRTMKDFWRSMKKHKYIGNIIPVVVNRPKDPSMSFQDGDETAEVLCLCQVLRSAGCLLGVIARSHAKQRGRERERQTEREGGGKRERKRDRQTERERNRQTDRQTERERERETDRQTDRERDRQADRQGERERERERQRGRERERERQTNRERERERERQTNRQAERERERERQRERERERETDRQTDRETDKQTDIERERERERGGERERERQTD